MYAAGANDMDKDKAKGMIFGLAIGDALGYAVEFISLDQIKQQYGPSGISDLPEPALFSDDTQMGIAIIQALISAGQKDLESIMSAIKTEFIQWYHSPENNRAPGNTCLQGVSNMENGIHWTESGVKGSKGCGSAMRSAPIGYLYQNDPERLKLVASASGKCTHGHPTADAGAIGAAFIVKLVLDGIDPLEMIPKLLEFTKGISEEFDEAILNVERCIDWDDEERALDFLGEGWVAEESVALALYCFLRYPDSYKKVIIRAANTNGDSDSIACIAGAISGAFLGIEAIPKDWVKRIEKTEYLDDLAIRLSSKKEMLEL
jgi:ADP-ribosylglycohydrolase